MLSDFFILNTHVECKTCNKWYITPKHRVKPGWPNMCEDCAQAFALRCETSQSETQTGNSEAPRIESDDL
jgi:hypothetical protein